jgi:hypothetical protein
MKALSMRVFFFCVLVCLQVGRSTPGLGGGYTRQHCVATALAVWHAMRFKQHGEHEEGGSRRFSQWGWSRAWGVRIARTALVTCTGGTVAACSLAACIMLHALLQSPAVCRCAARCGAWLGGPAALWSHVFACCAVLWPAVLGRLHSCMYAYIRPT